MFNWLFNKKKYNDSDIKDLIRVLKNGITININISGNLNNDEQRGNSLEERSRKFKIDACSIETKPLEERTREKETINTIPNLSKLKTPKVNFGEEV